jgi:putative DNA modification/repair radical SAM protein
MELLAKLATLADAAKYDASCASSGAERRDSRGGRGVGSTGGMGVCHSYAPDGRCISLLKILLTNFCLFDCHYCINRRSSNVRRARFTVDEVVALTLDFYRRNLIEGLFLSSGIVRNADYTMEQLVEVARRLREQEDFRGYIHLKTIPDADRALIERAGRYADRLSINIELPTAASIERLAPEKDLSGIKRSMARIRLAADEDREARRSAARMKVDLGAPPPPRVAARPRRFAPAGQSTQLIVGADASSDRTILESANSLYGAYGLRRVYYSAFSPIPDASPHLPLAPAPLVREHRLYQADWLLRFYGFALDEIAPAAGAMLDLERDPKLAWALAHPERFPVDVNRAPQETLLRVPGLGVRSVRAILAARRWATLRWGELARMRVPLAKAAPFLVTPDHRPTAYPPGRASAPARQLDLFA